jgi:hypothetical protein
MPALDLGPVGAVLVTPSDRLADAARQVEDLGYSTIMLTGGGLTSLAEVAAVIRATRTARVVPAILPEDRFPAADVNALYRELDAEHPGRFVVGVGGARSAHPVDTLRAHLAALDAVPRHARLFAALGPRMLGLARDAAAGALPTLAVDLARRSLGFLAAAPSYQASFRRMGFADDDITGVTDRLLEAVVACGHPDAVLERVTAHQAAGADHVAVAVLSDEPGALPTDIYRRLAHDLGL